MEEMRYTLITDGSSDNVLLPILTWALRENGIKCAIHPEWADLRIFRTISNLENKILKAVEFYPCDLLFIHRDAEKEPIDKRIDEINEAVKTALKKMKIPPVICVVPVRMQEAWLLIDKAAIRKAASNPNGKQPLKLPKITTIEKIPDPKTELHNCLKQASGLNGRRLKKFKVSQSARRIAEFIDDCSILRNLSAFTVFEQELQHLIKQKI